jgi:hypothetical protein
MAASSMAVGRMLGQRLLADEPMPPQDRERDCVKFVRVLDSRPRIH